MAGGQEIRRPSADSDPGAVTPCAAGTTTATTAGTNAYDASGTATSIAYTAAGSQTSTGVTRHATRLFNTWATPSGSYSSLSLNVNSACTDDTVNAGGDCFVQYSTDTGSSWTTIKSDSSTGGWTQQTNTVSLATNQTFSALQVRVCGDGFGSTTGSGIPAGTATITTFDIWTSGVVVTVPVAPTSMAATPAANALSVALTWTDNATNETGYQINRCDGGTCSPTNPSAPDNAITLTTLGANSTSFTDSTTVASHTYGYQAFASNASGFSAGSNIVYVTTPSLPAAPSGIAVSVGNSTAVITWADNASNETNYILQRCSGVSCTPADFQTLGANTTSFNDTTVQSQTTYTYNVLASNAVGRSAGAGNLTIRTPSHQMGGLGNIPSQ